MSNTTPSYYSIVKHSEVRNVIKEKKIEVCHILSEKISEEILKEAEKCHVMTYIGLEFLNSASEGIVTAWNFDKYFTDVQEQLAKEGYLSVDSNAESLVLYKIPLYTLEAAAETTEIEDEQGQYHTHYHVSLKKVSNDIDGFLFFWNNVNKDDKDDVEDVIDGESINDYVNNQIVNTIKQITQVILQESEEEIDNLDDITEEIKKVELGSDDEAIYKTKQDNFVALVEKYNSYKEVRI